MKGVLRVTVSQVSLFSAKTLSGESTTIQLSIGSQKSYVYGKGKSFHSKQIELFNCHRDILDIYAYNDGERDSARIVYGQVNLNPLLGLPKTKHLVNVQTIYFQNGIIVDEESGSIDLEIIYTEELDSILEITVESAKLIRDTQLVGKMDPYTEVTIEGETKKTTVKDNAGKEPVWDEKLIFILKNPEAKMVCVVKDLDVTTSDLVGVAEIDLKEQGLLNSEKEEKAFEVELMYKEKVAGHLSLRSRFTVNHFKK